ncbi:MAG TPA: reductive dehalogenase domain-containing protein [Syntrophorhabdaceae bacterium]|nr:reductive dehalogenase domain-containing protein [Syntrophorhabdaceae bacterium]
MENRTKEIAACLKEYKVDVFGFGDMSFYDKELTDLDNQIKGMLPFAISFGIILSRGVMDTLTHGPTQLYLHHYRQLNYRLDMIGYQLSREIENRGYRALPFAASQVIDWQNQRGHISHKHIGVIAGLGFIGRNNLLVHPVFGAYVRYNTVLTDMPVLTGKPTEKNCGACVACLAVCPASAIKETAGHFDHKGCYEMLNRFRKERNIGHHICGICVAACKGEK